MTDRDSEQTSHYEIVMPRLSELMEGGTIVKWMKSVGDSVKPGDDLVEIGTDKADMTYQSDVGGILREILVPEGEDAAVGSPIARVESAKPMAKRTAVSQPPTAEVPLEERAHVGTNTEETPRHERATPAAVRVDATPVARKLASANGVDLSHLTGTGPNGRITREDVERAAASPDSADAGTDQADSSPLTRIEQIVAHRMATSKTTVPHFYATTTIEMSAVVAQRSLVNSTKASDRPEITVNDVIVHACARALREHPHLRSALNGNQRVIHERIHIGIAVASDNDLFVPVLRDVDRLSLAEVAVATRELVHLARNRSLKPEHLADGAFTISNLGSFGVDHFAAIINPPQAAILAVGRIQTVPIADAGGSVRVGDVMDVTLSCDHRIIYGLHAARFLSSLRRLLEEPSALFEPVG